MDIKESFVIATPAVRPQPILPKPPLSTGDSKGSQIPNCNGLKSVNVGHQDFFHVSGSQNASPSNSKAILPTGRQGHRKAPSIGWTQIPVCGMEEFRSSTQQSNATMSPSQFVFTSGTEGLYQQSHSHHSLLEQVFINSPIPSTISDNGHLEQSSQNKLSIHLPKCVISDPPQITRNIDGSETTLIQFAPITPDKCKGTKDSQPIEVINLENRIKDSQSPEVIDLKDDRITKRSKQEKIEDGKITKGPINICFGQNNSDPANTSFVRFSLQAGNQTQGNADLQLRKQTQENVDLQDMNQSLNRTSSDSLVPVTPDKGKTVQASQSPEVVGLVFHKKAKEIWKQDNGIVPIDNKYVNICSDPAFGLSLGQETQKQGMEESCGVEQNKSPQQKPRRKRHRPKVITEGKQPKKPTQMMPKSSSTPENPSGKRKYVRKKAVNSASTANVDRQAAKPSSSVQKSVKRALNFDSEEIPVNDGFKASNLESEYETESELKASNRSTFNSALHVFQGPDKVIDPLTRITSNFSPSTNPVQKENEACGNSVSNPQPSKKHIVRENLKALARERAKMGTPSKGDSSLYCNIKIHSPFTPEIQKNKRSKRDCNPRVDGATLCDVNGNMISFDIRKNYCSGIDNSNSCHNNRSHQVHFIPQTYKKKRNKTVIKEIISNASSSQAPDSPRGEESLNNQQREVNSLADVQKILTPDKLQAKEHMLGHSYSETDIKHPYVTPVQDYSSTSQFTICLGQLPSAPKTPLPCDHRQVSATMQTVVEDKLSKVPRRKRIKKEQASEASEMYLNFLHGSRIISSSHVTCYSSFFSQTKVLHLVDFLTQKMKSLNINGHPEEVITQNLQQENALVLYGGGGAITSSENPFDFPRRRHPRPKVDLDSETNRVWMLLMGKNAIDGPDGNDIDKEKWWKEERKVFQGRADSFIARMHLVQGDRRFSQWKGSVVDSVVGVFLTQNVSDHLSSSAFMALAAKFPAQSRDKNQEINVMQEDIPRPGQVVPIVEFADCIKQKGLPNQHKAVHSSNIPSESQYVEKIEIEDMRSLEGTFSSQNSVVSSQNSSDSPTQAINQVGLSSESNCEVEDVITGNRSCRLDESTSFTEFLQLGGSHKFRELYPWRSGKFALKESSSAMMNELNCSSIKNADAVPDSHLCQTQHGAKEVLCAPCTSSRFGNCNCGFVAVVAVDVVRENQCILPPNTSSVTNKSEPENSCTIECSSTENKTEITADENSLLSSQINPACSTCQKNSDHPNQSIKEAYSRGLSCGLSCVEPTPNNDSSCSHSAASDGDTAELRQSESQADFQLKSMQISTEPVAQTPSQRVQQLNLKTSHCSSVSNVSTFECRDGSDEIMPREKIASNAINESAHAEIINPEKSRRRTEKKSTEAVDWDHLRRQTCSGHVKKERSEDAMDSIDWEAVRRADVSEISNTIRERGMNNKLAERIKDFLNRLVIEHGGIDLEWLRDVPHDKTKDYLLSIRGLGLKSVECVRLLTLHQLAFPVDTNIGRICVRLGWVPLQPLPESLQLHLLELYPILETIQKYLWPRFCKLDQRTLYELHYQMITFGKVFCTKSKPNCNACPMRGECKHFASAFASARLALPGPEEKSILTSNIPVSGQQGPRPTINLMPLPQPEGNRVSESEVHVMPIIEEPASPEPECLDTPESAIEDAFYEDHDEIPIIKLNIEKFTVNLQNIMQENNMELQEGDISKALVALTPEAASIPQPKLKNVNRLRTEHQVYELPDTHPLLEGLDQREPDDPCPYLLAIWTPGENAQSMESPEMSCSSQNTGMLCDKSTCFTCNGIREARDLKVRGTLLIPCRTAMRGSFPLNGTYFQVNEVFADHSSSLSPIDVPRNWIWNLPRRTVYFGTSIPTIFKGLTTEGIQHCFWRGFVCVRGFDQRTRAPRPLMARLHLPASKIARNRNGAAMKDE